MFANAIKIVEKFTRPVLAINRKIETIDISQDSATIFFVNEFGYAITTGEILNKFFPERSYLEKYKEYNFEKLKPNTDIEKLKLTYGYNNVNSIIDLKTIFLNCSDEIKSIKIWKHPHYNIGLLHFNNVSKFSYSGYAKFIFDHNELKKGTELFRLGYPFPESKNYSYNKSRDQIEWDMEKPFIIDSLPLKGIISSLFADNEQIFGIQMDSPGFKGHEGSPLFDIKGLVYGMHTSNSFYESNDDKNYPNIYLGNCISSNIITKFLLDMGVKFYQIEDDNEIIYNENNIVKNIEPLLPIAYLEAEDEATMYVSETRMYIEDKLVVDSDNDLQLSIRKTDGNSKKGGAVFVQHSVDGKNDIFISEQNAGNVQFFEKSKSYKLKVIKKVFKTQNWIVKAKVKSQSYYPFEYFDILVIRKNTIRNHLKDPHIAFFPDASGKYIRYDNEKTIKILTKKVIKSKNSGIVPLDSKIEADEFDIDILYSIDDNFLIITDITLIEK